MPQFILVEDYIIAVSEIVSIKFLVKSLRFHLRENKTIDIYLDSEEEASEVFSSVSQLLTT